MSSNCPAAGTAAPQLRPHATAGAARVVRAAATVATAAILGAVAAGAALAQPAGSEPGRALPDSFVGALRLANVPPSASAVVVLPLSPPGISAASNEAQPMNPASTMKLITTYAALNLLGPAYTWRTEAFAAGTLRRDVLDGDLALRGSGDPKLVIEHLWLLAHRLRAYGIREIRGDVVLDKSAFDRLSTDTTVFDGENLRPYNAGPDALLVNFKAVTFGFVPEPDTRAARVVVTPALAGMKAPPLVRITDGPCGDWRGRLQGDFSDPLAPVFRGAYPLSCGERLWHVNVLSHSQYFGAVFRSLWEGAGGIWSGKLREGSVPPEARRVALHESAPLADVIRDINKFSNNVMARQVFLTIGAEASRQPATTDLAGRAVRAWLARAGIDMPELVMDNGSGLSRSERVTASGLARLLAHAFNGPLMPEFMSSLPVAGVDGTMKSRNGAAGSAHIKTGLLADVRAIAGYVLAASGRRYVVVAIINHPNAGAAQPAHDALLEWLFRNG